MIHLRFRLGSAIWGLTLLAILLGWLVDRHQLQAQQARRENELLRLVHEAKVQLDRSEQRQIQMWDLLQDRQATTPPERILN
jgi:hypothetical protein